MLLLYILQKYSEKVEIFEGLLACSVSWCKNSCQWWRSHLVCLCVVITDCKKLKKFFVHVHTKFCGNWWTGSKVKMVGGRGTQHVILEAYIFLVGRKVTKNVKSILVLTLCSASTLVIRGTNWDTYFSVIYTNTWLSFISLHTVPSCISDYIRPHCNHDCIL